MIINQVVSGNQNSGNEGNLESAYDMAVAGGYQGTLEEFKIDLASIEGLADAIATIVGE